MNKKEIIVNALLKVRCEKFILYRDSWKDFSIQNELDRKIINYQKCIDKKQAEVDHYEKILYILSGIEKKRIENDIEFLKRTIVDMKQTNSNDHEKLRTVKDRRINTHKSISEKDTILYEGKKLLRDMYGKNTEEEFNKITDFEEAEHLGYEIKDCDIRLKESRNDKIYNEWKDKRDEFKRKLLDIQFKRIQDGEKRKIMDKKEIGETEKELFCKWIGIPLDTFKDKDLDHLSCVKCDNSKPHVIITTLTGGEDIKYIYHYNGSDSDSDSDNDSYSYYNVEKINLNIKRNNKFSSFDNCIKHINDGNIFAYTTYKILDKYTDDWKAYRKYLN